MYTTRSVAGFCHFRFRSSHTFGKKFVAKNRQTLYDTEEFIEKIGNNSKALIAIIKSAPY